MKTIKFKSVNVGDTFYIVGDYGRINQYVKLSDGFTEEIMTVSTVFIEDDVEIYID
jgi:hypothetical protein